MAGERHGHGMLCVNRPLHSQRFAWQYNGVYMPLIKGRSSLGTERKILGATRKEEVTDRSVTQSAHYVLDVSTDHLG